MKVAACRGTLSLDFEDHVPALPESRSKLATSPRGQSSSAGCGQAELSPSERDQPVLLVSDEELEVLAEFYCRAVSGDM